MAIPATTNVQLSAPGAATFSVVSMTDPNGNPTSVLDVDLGFEITGTASLPHFLQGPVKVTVYAHELGGSFNGKIGAASAVPLPSPPSDPAAPTSYKWKVTYDGTSNILPDPSTGSQVYELIAVLVYGDPGDDIGAFLDLGTFLIN